MKITYLGRTSSPARRPGANGARAIDRGESFTRQIEERSAPPPARATTAPNAMGAVLAVQEVGDYGARGQAVARGHRVLDELQELRLAIIDGWVPERNLRRLAGLVEQARAQVEDPRLAGVLEEIDLRAAVEVAKLEREPS